MHFPFTTTYSSSGSLESREEYTLDMSPVHPWVHTPFTPGRLLYLSTIKTFRLYSLSVYQRCFHLRGDSDRSVSRAGTITCRSNQPRADSAKQPRAMEKTQKSGDERRKALLGNHAMSLTVHNCADKPCSSDLVTIAI